MAEEESANDFLLKLDPSEKIIFSGVLGDESASVNLNVVNPTQERQICKVKSTSNDMFRIRPPVFALNPGEATDIKLTFNSGHGVPCNSWHFFVVHHIKSTDSDKKPRDCWAEHEGDPDGSKRLFVDFKDEGDPGRAESKDEEVESSKKEAVDAASDGAKPEVGVEPQEAQKEKNDAQPPQGENAAGPQAEGAAQNPPN